jgi:hypothetical protein
VVEQSIQAFQKLERLIMVVPPEGTRKKVSYWKTGGIGPTFYPTGRLKEDLQRIQAFYATITGKRRSEFCNAALKS